MVQRLAERDDGRLLDVAQMMSQDVRVVGHGLRGQVTTPMVESPPFSGLT
jgi:hypothetical protein